jgi:hypothetical protein
MESFGFGPGAGNGAVHFLGIVGIGDTSCFDKVLLLMGESVSLGVCVKSCVAFRELGGTFTRRESAR